MGSGIAQKMAAEGFTVLLADVDDEKVARGISSIDQTLAEGVERGLFSEAKARTVLSRVQGTSRLADVAAADLVVEAIFENLDAKRALFSQLGRLCDPRTILATNTSSFLVQQLAEVTAHAERVVGLHYFYHPAKNRLVEVVAAKASSPLAVRRAWQVQEAMGKLPIAASDAYGFIVNRFFAPWLIEAIRLVDEGGASIATVEQAAKARFGIGLGPFELMNVTGVPIALHTANTLQQAFGPMYAPTDSLAAKVADGSLWPIEGEVDESRFDAVADRLAGIVYLAAGSLVDEGVGASEDVDLGARVGLRWRSGPFELMNRQGIGRAAAVAKQAAGRWGVALPRVLDGQARRGAPFSFSVVRTEMAGGIATITINRPDKLNALNEAVVSQLGSAVRDALANPDIRGVVIAGRGRAFIAGADIGFFVANMDKGRLDRTVAFTRQGHELLALIASAPKPVIARVEGLTLGGGLELALACHLIVATPAASFAFPETGIGIYPGLGGTQRTTRRVGIGLAKWLVLTGERLDAERAQAIGLIDQVVAPAQLDAAVARAVAHLGDGRPQARPLPPELTALAAWFENCRVDRWLSGHARGTEPAPGIGEALASKAPIALRMAEELIERGASLPLDEALELELGGLETIFSTRDAYEGLTTIGRRPPHFVGS